MRFLADQNVEPPTVGLVRDAGHDVVSVRETMPGASDEEVLRVAHDESRILITNDKGFGDRIYRMREPCVGVLLLRFGAEDASTRARRLASALPRIEGQLIGHFTVLTRMRVRSRPLR